MYTTPPTLTRSGSSSLTLERQSATQDWLSMVIVSGRTGDLELTPKSWWRRAGPASSLDSCRRAIDGYVATQGALLNAASLANLSVNVMNLNAALSDPASGYQMRPVAHPVRGAGTGRPTQFDALTRELSLLAADRDFFAARSFTVDMEDLPQFDIRTYISRYNALAQEEAAAVMVDYTEVIRIVDVLRALLSSTPYHSAVAQSLTLLQQALRHHGRLLEQGSSTLHARLDELDVFSEVLAELDRGRSRQEGFLLPRCEKRCPFLPSGIELNMLMTWRRTAVSAIDHLHRFSTGVFASNPDDTPSRIPMDPLPRHYSNGVQQCIAEGRAAIRAYTQSRGRGVQ